MDTAPRRPAKEQEGQTTVEFALVALLLFLLLFAIIDFSRLMFAYATMSNGVREGARYAIVHPGSGNNAAIEAQTRAMMVVIGGDADVEILYPDDDPSDPNDNPYCSHECAVIVHATTNLDIWTPILPAIQIVTQAAMHFE